MKISLEAARTLRASPARLVVYVWSARNLAIPSSTARTKARCNDALPAEIEDI
jgi:hypothetical protein